MHCPGAMLDFLFVAASVAFFGVAWAYVRLCHRLEGAPWASNTASAWRWRWSSASTWLTRCSCQSGF